MVGVLACLVVLAAHAGPAGAQATSERWSGYISVVQTWSSSTPQGSTTHRERAQYAFDGEGADAGGPFRWEQDVSWRGSFHESSSSPSGCPGGASFTSNANGDGTGTGDAVVEFLQRQDGRWTYNVSAASTSEAFEVERVNSCGGNVTFQDNAFPASAAFDSQWNVLEEGQTPQGTVDLSGQRTFEGVTFCCDQVTVTWALTRGPGPECANGRDDDGDGFIDYAAGIPGLQDPGCESNDDDSEESETTLEVRKVLLPTDDPGRFDLLIDGTVRLANAGPGGTTGPITVEPGTHAVEETAGLGTNGRSTNLNRYLIDIACADQDANEVAEGPGRGPLSVPVDAGERITCTITNQVNRLRWKAGYNYGVWFIGQLAALYEGFAYGYLEGPAAQKAEVASMNLHEKLSGVVRTAQNSLSDPIVWGIEVSDPVAMVDFPYDQDQNRFVLPGAPVRNGETSGRSSTPVNGFGTATFAFNPGSRLFAFGPPQNIFDSMRIEELLLEVTFNNGFKVACRVGPDTERARASGASVLKRLDRANDGYVDRCQPIP